MRRLRSVFSLLSASYQAFFEDDVPRLAAALAFYALLSAAPLLLVAVGVAGLMFSQDAIRQDVLGIIETTIGPAGREVGATLFENAYDAYQPRSGVVASLIGGVLLLVASSGVFTQLNAALAKIWGTEHRVRGGIRIALTERLRGVGMVIVVGVLLMVSLAATNALTNVQRFLVRTSELSEIGLELLNLGLSVFVLAVFFATVYRAMPATDASWADVWPGAVVAAPVFAAANYALSFYLGTSALGSAYGAAGSLVVLLLWIYFAAMVFFYGAEVSSIYLGRRKSRAEAAMVAARREGEVDARDLHDRGRTAQDPNEEDPNEEDRNAEDRNAEDRADEDGADEDGSDGERARTGRDPADGEEQ